MTQTRIRYRENTNDTKKQQPQSRERTENNLNGTKEKKKKIRNVTFK